MSPRSRRSSARHRPRPALARPGHPPGAAWRRSPQACASCAALRSSILSEDIPQDGPLQWGRLSRSARPGLGHTLSKLVRIGAVTVLASTRFAAGNPALASLGHALFDLLLGALIALVLCHDTFSGRPFGLSRRT